MKKYLLFLPLILLFSCESSQIRKIEDNLRTLILEEGYDSSYVSTIQDNQLENGTWADIDYDDDDYSRWQPSSHIGRTLDLAIAWSTPGTVFYHNEAILCTIKKSISAFLEMNPVSPNWWYNEIGIPQNLGKILILIKEELPEEMVRQASDQVLSRARFGRTGTNKVWLAVNVLQNALIKYDYDTVKEARDVIFSEIEIAQRSEGIRPDFSFHQHGPILQIGNYGRHWIENMSWCARLFTGTNLAMSQKQKTIIHDFFFKGIMPNIYKGKLDLNAHGRQIQKESQRAKALSIAQYARNMSKVDACHANEYMAAAEAIESQTNLPSQSGAYYYPYSDYGIFRTSRWMATNRMNSLRTFGFETTNAENLKGYYSADGSLLVQVDGEEFTDIAPYWDWHLIPGTTTCHEAASPWGNRPTEFTNLTWNVSGTAGNGYLWTAFEYDRDGVHAKKVNVFSDDKIVSLGAGISCNRDGEVMTSVAQCFRDEVVYIDPERRRVWHRGVGYVCLGEGMFTVDTLPRNGSWHDIAEFYLDTQEPARELFLLAISHGVHPESASYCYATYPDVSLEDFKSMSFDSLQIVNTCETQGVGDNVVTWATMKITERATIDNIETDKGGKYN